MEKIKLSGFNLDDAEKGRIGEILLGYENKIERETGFNQLSLRLKKSQHGKAFLHEIDTRLEIKNKTFNAKVTDYNLFRALTEALDKILNELKHYLKKK